LQTHTEQNEAWAPCSVIGSFSGKHSCARIGTRSKIYKTRNIYSYIKKDMKLQYKTEAWAPMKLSSFFGSMHFRR
jgi:hypothetical protein